MSVYNAVITNKLIRIIVKGKRGNPYLSSGLLCIHYIFRKQKQWKKWILGFHTYMSKPFLNITCMYAHEHAPKTDKGSNIPNVHCISETSTYQISKIFIAKGLDWKSYWQELCPCVSNLDMSALDHKCDHEVSPYLLISIAERHSSLKCK